MFQKLFIIIFLSVSAHALQIDCTINSEVNGNSLAPKVVTLPLDGSGGACEQNSDYLIPGTQLTVSLHGHGNCNPAQGMCPQVGPSVDGIEAHDTASGTYSKAYGSCTTAVSERFLQVEVKKPTAINVVVGCQLK